MALDLIYLQLLEATSFIYSLVYVKYIDYYKSGTVSVAMSKVEEKFYPGGTYILVGKTDKYGLVQTNVWNDECYAEKKARKEDGMESGDRNGS